MCEFWEPLCRTDWSTPILAAISMRRIKEHRAYMYVDIHQSHERRSTYTYVGIHRMYIRHMQRLMEKKEEEEEETRFQIRLYKVQMGFPY